MSRRFLTAALSLAALVAAAGSPAQAAPAPSAKWTVVANNGDVIPGSEKHFNSYNQPSINLNGAVVFRARSKGGDGTPARGVYLRTSPKAPLVQVAGVGAMVPQPNNTDAAFLEFPAFPRIDLQSSAVVTRAQSEPVWTHQLPDGSDTRVGTSGVYATVDGVLAPAATLLGAAPGYGMYAVPDVSPVTRFDQFPGAPAITAGGVTVFKGNYTVNGLGQTGVFYRDVRSPSDPVRRIAGSTTAIPGAGGVTFGSTAPPSAAGRRVVFLGVDSEDAPTIGGIYLAPLAPNSPLTLLVGIGSSVPDHDGFTFNRLGEALSFDGRYVSFWGAWGAETRSITLSCPTDGNASLLAYCNELYPSGYTTSVPVHQGIFVHDTDSGVTTQVAEIGDRFKDFLYWTFSGRAPGAGGGEEDSLELARWRSASFASVNLSKGNAFEAAFKARTVAGNDGVFTTTGPALDDPTAVVDTTMLGTAIDPEAPAGSTVIAVGIERDGLRNGRMAITATMYEQISGESWAGVYVGALR